MKRYLAFEYEAYYPSGGAKDFYGMYNSLQEALDALEITDETKFNGWGYNILDTETMCIVASSYKSEIGKLDRDNTNYSRKFEIEDNGKRKVL